MTMDIQRAIGAITRELITREHEGKPAQVIVATRSYSTDIDDLWDALTNAERLPRWFLPVSGDLKLGGRYQLEGNAGGEITTCDPPRHLAVTWEYGGSVSWVDVQLTAGPDGDTQLRLEHTAHTPEEFWEQYGAGATGVGWDLGLIGLAEHFQDEPEITAESSTEWATSEEGKRCVRESSEAWYEAAIAGGEDQAAARAAADRTTAFYTGEADSSGEA